jgi:hypothetical protein
MERLRRYIVELATRPCVGQQATTNVKHTEQAHTSHLQVTLLFSRMNLTCPDQTENAHLRKQLELSKYGPSVVECWLSIICRVQLDSLRQIVDLQAAVRPDEIDVSRPASCGVTSLLFCGSLSSLGATRCNS